MCRILSKDALRMGCLIFWKKIPVSALVFCRYLGAFPKFQKSMRSPFAAFHIQAVRTPLDAKIHATLAWMSVLIKKVHTTFVVPYFSSAHPANLCVSTNHRLFPCQQTEANFKYKYREILHEIY